MSHSFLSAAMQSIYCFFKEQYSYRASALAFTTVLAIVPLFVVILFFITFFPVFGSIVSLSQNYLLENFAPSASVDLVSYFTLFIQQATTLPIGNMIFLFITATLLVHTVDETINSIWKTELRRKKWLAFLFYWLIIILTPIIIGMSVFISTAFLNLYWVASITKLLQLKLLIDFILPVIINSILFSLLYIVVPNRKVSWQSGMVAGFLTAIIFNFARIGFAWSIKQFQSYSVIYGAFAVIPLFMVWMYIAWLIIIWGALFSYQLQKLRSF